MQLKYCSLPISSYKAHTHKVWEIVCQLEGEVQTQVGDQTLTVRTGDVLFIPPNTVHEGRSNGIFRDISLHSEALSFPHFACFHDESGDLSLAGFHVFGVDAVAADDRIGDAQKLACAGGVGDQILIADHGGVEDDFAAGQFNGAGEGDTFKDESVFEGEYGSHAFSPL